jgi:phospholipid/cholesterol/gamma-HCH transport system substrate-binding protein
MENKAHALVAGAFVVVVAALLALLAIWLTRDTSQRDLYEMSTSDTVSGLQPQAAVRFRGVPVGKVEVIGFDEKVKGNVLIRVSIDRNAPVTRSTFATVASQGVTGLGFIQLDDNGESKERVTPNDDEPPRIPLQPGGLDKLLKQSETIFDQLEQASTKMNRLFDANEARVATTLDSVGKAAGSLDRVSTNLDAVVSEQFGPDKTNVPLLVKNLNGTLLSLQRTSEQANRAVGEIGVTARRLNEKGGPLDKLSQGSEALASSVETFGSSTLPRLGEVADETTSTMRQLRRTVNAVEGNPQSLIYGNGTAPPGPGEPGFSVSGARP